MTRSNGGSAQGYKTHNPHYLRLGYLRLLEQFVTTLGDYGLLVMLDLHAGVADYGRTMVRSMPPATSNAWTTLTRVFCDPVRYWNVFAADLRNEPHGKSKHSEPHGMYWGPMEDVMGNYKKEDRWDTLAATLGNQVLMQCPRWLVFVEESAIA